MDGWGFFFSVASGVGTVLLTNHVATTRARVSTFNDAAFRFRAAFSAARARLRSVPIQSRAEPPDILGCDYERHFAAMVEFSAVLRPSEKAKLEKAWYCYCQDEEPNGNPYFHLCQRENLGLDAIELRRKAGGLIENLLSSASYRHSVLHEWKLDYDEWVLHR